MKKIFVFILLSFFFSCKTTSIYNEVEYEEINKNLINKPQIYLGEQLAVLLNDALESNYEVNFNTTRHFILESISLKFINDQLIQVYFDRNTEFDFGGGLMNDNIWDIEKLKLVKIGALKIYQDSDLISHHCKWKYCKM